MSRLSRRILGSPGLLAIGVLLVLPAMAEAQLLPNLPIRRQKPSCAAENPYYAHVRRDYYGYFPTCWSRFPEGWACPCPNPELPNAAESFRKQPLDKPSDTGPGEPGLEPEDEGMSADPGTADPNLPPVPDPGRSPFEINPKPDAPDASGTPAPAPADPFTPGGRTSPPTTLREPPRLPEIAPTAGLIPAESGLEPGSMTMAPEVTQVSNRSMARPNLGPLPDPNPSQMIAPEPTVGVPAPAQAPQRRSLLGGLFGQGNRRRR